MENLEVNLPYRLLALLVLAAFYGIYFAKLLGQRSRGIQTNQIGRRKEKALHRIEMLLSFATTGIVCVQLLSIAFGWNCLPANARFAGFCVGLLGDLLFLIAVLGMRDSWRAGIPDEDKTELVTGGIYRYSRNPAFLSFDLMYLGILLMYCNLLTVLFTGFAALILHLQILQEEKYLAETFGTEYQAYKNCVYRYLGRRW